MELEFIESMEIEIDREKISPAGINRRNMCVRFNGVLQLKKIIYSFIYFWLLEGEEENGIKQIMVILIGLPGSGKSTFCDEVMKISRRTWARVCQVRLHYALDTVFGLF